MSCRPIGNFPLEKPHGIDMEGVPVRLLNEVKVFLGAMMLIAVVFNNYIRKRVTESK